MRRCRLEGRVLPKDLLLSKDLSGMILRLNLLWTNDTFDDSVFVDDKRGAESTHVSATVHFLLTIDAEGVDEFQVGVGNEREGKFVLLDKLLV